MPNYLKVFDMRRILPYLIIWLSVSLLHAGDQWLYGAWWATSVPKGSAKSAGDLRMVLRDFPNAAGLGYIEARYKSEYTSGDGSLIKQIGGWRILGKSILIDIKDPDGEVFSFKGKINGTINLLPATLSGAWTWPSGQRKGKFQGSAVLQPL
jgi:hypothetical protein